MQTTNTVVNAVKNGPEIPNTRNRMLISCSSGTYTLSILRMNSGVVHVFSA